MGESTMTNRRKRRTFTAEFKSQMVQLFQSGKSKSDLIREHDLTPSALDRWIFQAGRNALRMQVKFLRLLQ